MKVKALKTFEMVIDNEVGRERKLGEEWEVSEKRLAELQAYPVKLVEVIGTASLEKKVEKKVVKRTKKNISK